MSINKTANAEILFRRGRKRREIRLAATKRLMGKGIFVFWIWLCASFALGMDARAQTAGNIPPGEGGRASADSGSGARATAPDFSKIAPHPRLFMPRGAEQKILDDIKTRPQMRMLHESCLEFARELMDRPLLKRNQIGFRILHTSKEATLRMMYWGYAWRMTGDRAFADRALREIENLSKFDDWNPRHYLDVAEMTLAFAIARDWFDSAFDDSAKRLIARQIEEKAFGTFFGKRHGWFYADRVNNWNQLCNMGLLCGAIAIFDESSELSEKFITQSLENIRKGLSQCYSKEGSYIEGYSYWAGTTFYQTLYFSALETAFGTDFGLAEEFPGYLRSGKFADRMMGPCGFVFNFFDAGARGTGQQPLLFRFAKRTADPSLLFSQRAFYDKKFKPSMQQNLFVLIWASDTDFDAITPPKDLVWSDTESANPLVLARSGWTGDSLFLGVKGGRGNLSHGHIDASSFVFDADGERWAFDLGGQNYNSLEKLGMKIWDFRQNGDRWKVFRYSNFSHNMITVNDALADSSADVRISRVLDSPEARGAEMETSALYFGALKKCLRRVAIADGKRLEVSDKIENGSARSKISWRMATRSRIEKTGRDRMVITSPRGKKLLVSARLPEGFEAAVLPASSGNPWDDKNPGMAIAAFEGYLKPDQKAEIFVELKPISAEGKGGGKM